MELSVLPGKSLVPVINAKAGGDAISEGLAPPVKVVIIEQKPAQSDDADNHADFSSFLSAIRRRSFPRSSRFLDNGRRGTKNVRVVAADAFLDMLWKFGKVHTITASESVSESGLVIFFELGIFGVPHRTLPLSVMDAYGSYALPI